MKRRQSLNESLDAIEEYCERRGITYEEMTEEDFIDAYEHEYC